MPIVNKLRIGYTLGDLAGVGPEIFYKFQKHYHDKEELQIVLLDSNFDDLEKKIQIGKACALSGEHAYKTLLKADTMLKNKDLDYLITGPVAKESLWLAGIQCSGQTELLARINGLTREEIEMFFILDNFRVVLATRHIAIADVAQVLEERLSSVINNSILSLKNLFKIPEPKIAVAGLNPHAGENGIIGLEENKFIKSCIESFKDKVNISGPFSADTLFAQAAQTYLSSRFQAPGSGEESTHEPRSQNQTNQIPFDLFVAAYHDQILPLIKGIGGLKAINLTYGLPYVRLSVDHGTGFDIVGQNIASYAGLEACTDYCFSLSALKMRENVDFRVKS